MSDIQDKFMNMKAGSIYELTFIGNTQKYYILTGIGIDLASGSMYVSLLSSKRSNSIGKLIFYPSEDVLTLLRVQEAGSLRYIHIVKDLKEVSYKDIEEDIMLEDSDEYENEVEADIFVAGWNGL